MTGVVLADADASGSDMILADVSGGDFTRADLRFAKFVGADCSRARFQWADLSNADFTKAKLTGANFWGARLRRAKLPASAFHWRLILFFGGIFLIARRKREEMAKRDQQRRIRDTVKLVRELERKDPRLRRQSGGPGR